MADDNKSKILYHSSQVSLGAFMAYLKCHPHLHLVCTLFIYLFAKTEKDWDGNNNITMHLKCTLANVTQCQRR